MTRYSQITEDLKRVVTTTDGLDSLSRKHILITGANGHIAQWLAFSLIYLRRNCGVDLQLTLLSRNGERLSELYSEVLDSSTRLIAGDVSNCANDLKDLSFDYIFHLAGDASPYAIKHDPVGIMKTNILGTDEMARISLKDEKCRLVYASSREVYGEVVDRELLEESDFGRVPTLEPRSCYPESKRAAEALLESYHVQHGLDFVVTRIAHCYGPGMKRGDDGRVMQDLIGYAMSGNDIVLNSTGEALRAFCYITDVISGILTVALKGTTGEAYNVSNETEEISVRALAEKICALHGGIKMTYNVTDKDRNAYCSYKRIGLDTSKIEKLGWHACVDLDTGLRNTLEQV